MVIGNINKGSFLINMSLISMARKVEFLLLCTCINSSHYHDEKTMKFSSQIQWIYVDD